MARDSMAENKSKKKWELDKDLDLNDGILDFLPESATFLLAYEIELSALCAGHTAAIRVKAGLATDPVHYLLVFNLLLTATKIGEQFDCVRTHELPHDGEDQFAVAVANIAASNSDKLATQVFRNFLSQVTDPYQNRALQSAEWRGKR